MCNRSVDGLEDGGGTHSSPTASGLGISSPANTPQFSEFCLGLGGGTKVFYPRRPDSGDLKSHHLQARVTLTALSMSPGPHFLSEEHQCHISMHYRIYSQYHLMRENRFLWYSWSLRGGGGGPRPPPPRVRHWYSKSN